MIAGGGGLTPVEPVGHAEADRSLSAATRARILDAMPESTRRAYARQAAAFTAWCGERGRLALPATTETLAEYVTHLADGGRAPSAIEQAVAAIRTAHRVGSRPCSRGISGRHSPVSQKHERVPSS